MRTTIVKLASIGALTLAAIFWRGAANYQLLLNLVVSVSAIVVAVQAARTYRYRWSAGFAAIALLFNPAVPLFQLAGQLSLWLVLLAIAPFAVSLATLKPAPLLSIPSITDRNPGSESL